LLTDAFIAGHRSVRCKTLFPRLASGRRQFGGQVGGRAYASHGTSDSVMTYDGAGADGGVGGGVGLCQNFAEVNGCTWVTPTKVTSGDHVCTNFAGCVTGYPVEFCSFAGVHTPDPTDSGQPTSWEYQNVWNFFSQF
jgi:hypothetical protein